MLLIIDKSQKNAMTISDIFYYMGIVSGISSPESALSEVSNRYNAILISNPEKIGAVEELIRSLRRYSLGAPVFALSDDVNALYSNRSENAKLFDKVFPADSFSSDIVYSILAYQKERGMKLIGNYQLAGIDASIFSKCVTYFDMPIAFTKTETMIIRYMISSYPSRSKAEDILKFSFKHGKMPEISNIRTHISIINKKFRAFTDKNLIVSEPRVGYTILTPIKQKELSLL